MKRKLSTSFVGIDKEPTKKNKRGPYLSEPKRKAALESNVLISLVEPHRVKCGGCKKWVLLHNTRTYKADAWEKHERSCEQITGTRKIRIAVKQPAKNPVSVATCNMIHLNPVFAQVTGAGAIHSFFGPQLNEHKTLPAESSSKASVTQSESDDDSNPSKPKMTYKSKVVFAVC